MRQVAKSPTKPKETTDQAAELGTVDSKFRKWFPELASQPETLAKFIRFHDEFLKVSRTISLVAPQTVKNAEAVHFADSIAACRLISKAVVVGQPVFDLSGGTGFPGLAFAILFPKHKVVILDRDTKKFEFPKHVTSVLGLSNVSFEAKSLDDLAPGSVWNLVSRSNAPLMKAMLGARKVVAQGGRFFHVKSDSWATELSSVPSQLFSFWSPSLIGQYRVPDTSLDFSVVQTEKIAE